MNLKFIPIIGIAFFTVSTAIAQDSTAVSKPTTAAVAKIKPYKQVITDKAVTKVGVFKVHNIDNKYFFEIPDELLSREFLFTTRLSKVATGSPRFGGDLMNAMIVTFEKAPGDRLFIRPVINADQSEDSNELSKAVKNSTVAPIIMSIDVKARSEDGKASVIEVTDFFLKDNLISGFHASAKKQMGTGAPAADRSALLSMDAFPLNIEIKSMKTYSLGAAPKPDAEGGATVSPSAGVTFEISNSVLVLPAKGMQVQAYDPRVGFKGSSTAIFADDQQKVDKRLFIVKNRFEIRPEDIAAYKSGKLVEPKEPLVYYIDPATPKQYRKYMIAGINNWNEAFKEAGFKNAIIGKEWPENEPGMNMEDARYRVIRYMPSTAPFVDNNVIPDPRTGEIVQTHIGWSHAQVKELHDWYMVQAAAVDPGARNMKFNEELMGALITAEISRAIGLSLGMSENLGSSFTIPVERLRDKNYLAKNPYNNSIMDYNHYNYVAQPEDKVSRNGLIPQIGVYDKWAIKWAYSYTGAADFEADKKIRTKWINENVKENGALQFAGQLSSVKPVDVTDPSAQWEDLGDDPIKAAYYGINNLKYIMKNLVNWTTMDDNTYFNTSDIYYTMVNQYSFFLRHAFTQVGGVHERIKAVGQKGDVYTPVPKSVQREAVQFLVKEGFNTPEWLMDASVLNKFKKPAKKEEVTRMQDEVLYQLTAPKRLFRMNVATIRFGKENTYTIEEMLTDLSDGMYAEIKTGQNVDGNKRFMQKTLVSYLLRNFGESEGIPDPAKDDQLIGTDVAVILYNHLNTLYQEFNQAIPKYTDPVMLAHVKYMAEKINNVLKVKN